MSAGCRRLSISTKHPPPYTLAPVPLPSSDEDEKRQKKKKDNEKERRAAAARPPTAAGPLAFSISAARMRRPTSHRPVTSFTGVGDGADGSV
ncbi:hypothetical protein Hanom_Chr01g00061421 [Helianthus anomalus]